MCTPTSLKDAQDEKIRERPNFKSKFLDLFGQMIKNSPTAGVAPAIYENPEFHMESGMVQVTESDTVVWF